MVEVTEATVSPLTKSTSSRVNNDLMWVKMMELHPHVQQDSTEATGRKIRRHCLFANSRPAGIVKLAKFIAAQR